MKITRRLFVTVPAAVDCWLRQFRPDLFFARDFCEIVGYWIDIYPYTNRLVHLLR